MPWLKSLPGPAPGRLFGALPGAGATGGAAAAPARLDAPTNSVSFVFRRNLFLSGDGSQPSSLYLDFGDGNGYHSAA